MLEWSMKYLLMTIALALAVGPAFAQFYQYTDKNGNVVITDSPPPGSDATEKKIDGERVYSFGKSASDYPDHGKKRGERGSSREEEKTRKNYSRVSVAMYMADW